MTLDELSVSFTADISAFASAVSQVSSLISSASAEADQLAAKFSAAGAAAGDGLRSGILSRRGAVMAAARAVAAAAATALRSALDIHSPSRVTYQVGAYFDQGLLEGISRSAAQVEKEAAQLGQSAARALAGPEMSPAAVPFPAAAAPAAPAAGAESTISLTIPLEIDGYRLGVAAIEGINRVTQGRGRVELTL